MLSPDQNPTLSGIGQGLVGILGFAAYFLPAGFLALRLVAGTATRRAQSEERLLWAAALGVPVATEIAVLGGRRLSGLGVNLLFLVLDLAAAWFWFRDRRRGVGRTHPNAICHRSTRVALWIMGLFAFYCVIETADVQIGHGVYLSTVLSDWSVRVSMVNAAMRSAVPPINGLSTVSAAGLGHAPHLRYYYFWYVVVAQMARTFGLRAQPALAASCVWAGWSFLASILLALKYMVGVRERLRTKSLVLLGVLGVLGLDLLPTGWLWASRSHHPFPEMEWWHQDRTPSFLGSVLYAPHHMAAWCSLIVGFLVLVLSRSPQPDLSPRRAMRSTAFAALLAGCAFSAAAGLSIFPTFCFVFVLLFWAVDLIRRRDWTGVITLAASGLVALALAHPYLRELGGGSSAASGFADFAWRNDPFVAGQFARTGTFRGHGPLVNFLIRQPVVLALDLFELGFYGFVLGWAVRRDLFNEGRLSPGLCAWWALLFGAAVPALFLTSTATSGPNDLGVDAGFLFRLALQLRAVEWIWQHWRARDSAAERPHRWLLVTASALAALGLGAQVYQAFSIRFYFPVVGSGRVHKQMDALTQDHLSERLFNIRTALQQFDRGLPASDPDTEAIQFNPIGAMTPAEVYFNDHQIASWDTGCGTSYGGEYKVCAPIYSSLLFLYGNTETGVLRGRAQNDRQDGAAPRVATVEDLAAVCRDLKLRAVVAESTDSIWHQPDSWVWTAPVLVANSTVRVISCPAGSWRP